MSERGRKEELTGRGENCSKRKGGWGRSKKQRRTEGRRERLFDNEAVTEV